MTGIQFKQSVLHHLLPGPPPPMRGVSGGGGWSHRARLELLGAVLHEGLVEVLSAEVRIPTGRLHLSWGGGFGNWAELVGPKLAARLDRNPQVPPGGESHGLTKTFVA